MMFLLTRVLEIREISVSQTEQQLHPFKTNTNNRKLAFVNHPNRSYAASCGQLVKLRSQNNRFKLMEAAVLKHWLTVVDPGPFPVVKV